MHLPGFLEYENGSDFIRLTGHRVGLAHVVREYNLGSSAEMIAVRFPSLRLSHIYSVLAYYLDNRAEVDAYVAADDAELQRMEAESRRDSTAPTYEELKRRFDAMRPSAG